MEIIIHIVGAEDYVFGETGDYLVYHQNCRVERLYYDAEKDIQYWSYKILTKRNGFGFLVFFTGFRIHVYTRNFPLHTYWYQYIKPIIEYRTNQDLECEVRKGE